MANQKHNATLRVGAALDRTVGAAFKGLKKGLQDVSKAAVEVEKRQREIGKAREALVKQGKAVDDLDREYEQLGRTLSSLQAKQRRFERLGSSVARVGSSFRSLRDSATAAGKAVALGLTAIGGSTVALVKSTADAGYEIQRLSTLSNASTDEFQRWAAAARTVGIEEDKLSDILKDVNDRVGDFKQTGGGPMADFFEKIGPKVGVTVKHFRDLSGPEALQLYVSSLEKAKVNQQDFTFYMEAMASDSTLLLPLLKENGAAIQQLGDAAAESGAIMSEDMIRASIRYRREMGQLGNSLRGVRNTVGAELIPVFGDFVQAGNVWVRTHSPQIREAASDLGQTIRDVAPPLLELGSGLGKAARAGAGMVKVAADIVGGWENLGVVLGAVIASPLIFRTLALATAIGRVGIAVGAVVLATNPVGAAIAVIAGGAALIISNWSTVEPFFTHIWETVQKGFARTRAFVQPVTDWLGSVAGTIADRWGVFADRMAALLDRVANAFERAKERAGRVVEWFKSAAESVREAGTSVGGTIKRGAGRVAEGARRVGSAVKDLWNGEEPQARAVGGAFRPGPLRVGERGEELIYAHSSGFVAHNNALRGLEGRAERVRDLARSASGELSSARQPSRPVAAGPVTINVYQAPGQDPAALVREIKRQLQAAGRGALFDGVHA